MARSPATAPTTQQEARLQLKPGGALRVEGHGPVIDLATPVRIFSARVEIP
jgi:hypothetical protein